MYGPTGEDKRGGSPSTGADINGPGRNGKGSKASEVVSEYLAQQGIMNIRIMNIIREAGGIVVVPSGVGVPQVPEKYSKEFLNSKHPLREGIIASHVILGYDPESGQWVCIDRGEGGASDVIPGSLGLSGARQDKIIANVEVKDVCLRPPNDCRIIKRVLDTAIAQHVIEGNPIESLPFNGVYGRTADTERAGAYQEPDVLPDTMIRYCNENDKLVSGPVHIKRAREDQEPDVRRRVLIYCDKNGATELRPVREGVRSEGIGLVAVWI